MSTILPTHHCFDDALDLITLWVNADGIARVKASGAVVVHAVCLAPDGPNAGEPFAHAWVEAGDRIFQDGFLEGQRVTYSAELASTRAQLRIQYERRYSVAEVMLANRVHNGPWDERIQALCAKPREARVFVP